MRLDLLAKSAILYAALAGATAFADDIVSGLPVGATTMSIPVSDVTGPYKGELICYVCDYDKAPNVLAFFRDTSDATAKEIIQLNDLYLKNKSRNFKAVAMIIAGESSKKWLDDLNRSAHIEIPLTFFRKGPKDAAARARRQCSSGPARAKASPFQRSCHATRNTHTDSSRR